MKSPTAQPLEYAGSSGLDFDLGKHSGRLSDDLGNSYPRVDVGVGSRAVGQLKAESIDPGKSVDDLLLFEPRMAKAGYLKLDLPAVAIGGRGLLRIKIPAEMIEGK